MAKRDYYRFQISPDFYDRLHRRREDTLAQENLDCQPANVWVGRKKGWMAGLLRPREANEIPSREDLADIVNTAFWASLGKEEGRPVRFKVAYTANREVLLDSVDFVHPIEYSVDSIVKLAHSCGEYGHLLVSTSADGLQTFGRAENSGSLFAVSN